MTTIAANAARPFAQPLSLAFLQYPFETTDRDPELFSDANYRDFAPARRFVAPVSRKLEIHAPGFRDAQGFWFVVHRGSLNSCLRGRGLDGYRVTRTYYWPSQCDD